jgi:hypothetical protein
MPVAELERELTGGQTPRKQSTSFDGIEVCVATRSEGFGRYRTGLHHGGPQDRVFEEV